MTQPLMDVTSVTISTPTRGRSRPSTRGCSAGRSPPRNRRARGHRRKTAGHRCDPPRQTGPTLNFEYEAHYTRPAWPSEPGRQHITQHLDIAVEDLGAAVAWAARAGATQAGYQPQERVRVMLDPAGHPFCLFLR